MQTSHPPLQSKEYELLSTKSLLQKLMGAIQDPVLVIKPDYTVVEANTALLAFLDAAPEEIVGRKCHQVSHRSDEPCCPPEHECPLRVALLKKSSAHSLHEHQSADGSTRYYDVGAYPIKDIDGEVDLVLEIWRDVSLTLQREVEKKALKIKHDLTQLVHEDKMIALGKLVASAVHEINNPISAIHTFSKVMLRMIRESEGRLTPEDISEMEQFLELMSTESKRCGEIVSNLVSFSRHRKMNRREIDINEIVGKIVLLLKHKMELGLISHSTDLAHDLPRIFGDLNQIQQVFMNLVFNATEAMPEGGALHLKTYADESRENVLVEIRDTGHGIPPEIRSKVFEPFFSTKRNGVGVGLGLAVVYGIVKEHRGAIEFESEPGQGTCFRVALPITCPGAST